MRRKATEDEDGAVSIPLNSDWKNAKFESIFQVTGEMGYFQLRYWTTFEKKTNFKDRYLKVETTLPLQKEVRILQFTKDESLTG